MNQQPATAVQPEKDDTSMRLLRGSDLLDRIEATSNSIARRAFEIFENRGRALGHDIEDWLRAESELLHPIHLDITESDDLVIVRAEAPGFTAKELEVGVEPHRVTISGKRQSHAEHAAETTIYSERCVNQIFRTVDLRGGVDPSKVTATLKDGVLELSMPKATKAQSVKIKERAA